MSDSDVLYPVTTVSVEYESVTIPPNAKLGTPEMPGILVTLGTTAGPKPIQFVIPMGTARDLHAALGAALLKTALG